jgi:serine/threonine-protein kinase
MGNPSGTMVNGKRVSAVELSNLDEIRAGYTDFRIEIPGTSLAGERRAEDSPSKKSLRMTPKIPGYRIDRELGRGPLGAVYEAVREEDNATVAIKTIIPAIAPEPNQADAFLQDVAGLWKMKHPHILSYSEIGVENDTFWFVMDRIVGTHLGSLMKERGKMEEKTAIRLMLQVLSALEHAHTNEMAHSDLKPSNIFLEEQPDNKRVVRVAEFGLAKAYAMLPISGLSLTDHVNPSVECLAPEQISNFRTVSAAADQFSAAVVLYRLLTDKSPYNMNPTAHPLGQILNGSIVPLRHHRRDLSPNLVDAVEKALAYDPADRFPDVRTFAEALFPFAK